jgi:hypothetical protein
MTKRRQPLRIGAYGAEQCRQGDDRHDGHDDQRFRSRVD